MTDRFFNSGYDLNVLLGWIDEVRTNLQSLNTLVPGNSTTYYLTTSRQILEKNSLKTLELYALSKSIQLTQQGDLKNQQNQSEKIAAQVIVENVLNQTINEKFLQADRTSIQTQMDQIIQSASNEAKFKALIPDKNNQPGYSRTFSPRNPVAGDNTGKSPIFPKLNQEYNNYMEEISSDMITRDSFPVFTGAKDPANPDLTFFRSWAKIKTGGTLESDPSKTFSPDKPYSSYISQLIKDNDNNIPIGSYKFFIEKLHGRYSNGVPYKKNKVKSTKTQNKIPTELSNRMVFAAYINNYNDGYSLEKSDYNFIGRAEGFPVYKQTKRTLTLEFSIMADFSSEMMVAMSEVYRQTQNITPNNIDDQLEQVIKNFPDWGLGILPTPQVLDNVRSGSFIPGTYSDTPESLWYKMNFLAQCCYPYYRADGKMKEQPMVRIRIADFYDVTGMITSYNISLDELEGIQIDLNPSNIGNIPLAARVTISVDIYHDFEPSSNFFGFYHRKEFDEGTIDPVTGGGSLGVSKEKNDTIAENITKNSPASIFNTIKNERLLDTPAILSDKSALKGDILALKKNIGDIANAGIKIADALLASRTKKAMQAYMRIQKIVNVIRIQQGLPAEPPASNAQDGVNIFGNTIPSVFKGNNVAKTIKDQITSNSSLINPNINVLKDNYSNLMGSAQSIIGTVTDSVKQLSDTVSQVGIDLNKNQSLDQLVNNVEIQKLGKVIPRTIGDIINGIKSKEGPNQNNNGILGTPSINGSDIA